MTFGAIFILSLWDGYPEISAHLKCNNMASLVEAKYHTVATIQEPIIRSEQFPCACVMAFSRTSLFLECLSAKPRDLEMIFFAF